MRRAADWRQYQRYLQGQRRRSAMRRAVNFLLPLTLVLGFTFLAVWRLVGGVAGGSSGPASAALDGTPSGLGKLELAGLLGDRLVDEKRPGLLTAASGQEALYGQTTIDADLQRYASELLADSGSLRGACVILEPQSGRILALASHDPGRKDNLCLAASPAASLFKLVTAAAAIEERGLRASSPLFYNGDPYSLARRNLRARPNRYSSSVTLARAFANSINPVFGQLGALEVGAARLRDYGARFGFNRLIPFELPLADSHLEVPEDEFNVARVASGFNRTTTITPVHAALLAAAVVTGGRMVEPCVLERVVDCRLKPLYTPRPATLERLFSVRTARELRRMMQATVTEGTCRRSVRRVLGRDWLRRVEVGGKTGSISANRGKTKYDWFAGYALERYGERRLAVAVLQMHGDYLGRRSPAIAAQIIRHYFQPPDSGLRSAAKANKGKKAGRT